MSHYEIMELAAPHFQNLIIPQSHISTIPQFVRGVLYRREAEAQRSREFRGRFAARLGACGAGRCGLWPRLSGGPTAVSAAYCYRPPAAHSGRRGVQEQGDFSFIFSFPSFVLTWSFCQWKMTLPPALRATPLKRGDAPEGAGGSTGCWILVAGCLHTFAF